MSNDAQPPRMLSAPLRLTAMTLRGLGPYLHGARLEIKPLTILCGENGSGKSTWIEMLSKLKATAVDESFQFSCLYDPDAEEVTTFSRSDLHPAVFFPTEEDWPSDPAERQHRLREKRLELLGSEDKRFGPPVGIGLEIEATQSLRLFNDDAVPVNHSGDCSSCAEQFLWLGTLNVKTRLDVRWAYPSLAYQGNLQDGSGLYEWIELVLDKRYALRLYRQLGDPFDITGKGGHRPWIFECSKAFLFGNGPNEADTEVIENVVGPQWLLSKPIDESRKEGSVQEIACRHFLQLFRQIVNESLSGFFLIGPIRETQAATATTHSPIRHYDEENLQELPTTEQQLANEEVAAFDKLRQIVEQASDLAELRELIMQHDLLPRLQAVRRANDPNPRYVGYRGESTQELHAHWAYNLMRQTVPPYAGAIDNTFNLDDFFAGWEVGELRELRFPIHHKLKTLKNLEKILELSDPIVHAKWESGITEKSSANETSIKLLNDLLTKRNLYGTAYWPNLRQEAQMLIDQGIENLSEDEYIRLNRLLLESLFSADRSPSFVGVYCKHRSGYLFETFVSYWLKRLTDTDLKYGDFHGAPLNQLWNERWQGSGVVPNGVLVHRTREWFQRGGDKGSDGYREPNAPWGDLNQLIRPPTFPAWTACHVMSTGFHQLAPIVVQAGLLRQNEIMAVENPEAHLHPKLQIEVAEFLMHQANAGKIMLIETHSDLFVRRVLRAIREEQVSPGNVFKQSSVGINFTSLVDDPKGFSHAKIEELAINDQGQIGNWPPGFMTDSLDEARRFIDDEMDDLSDEGTSDE